MIGSIAISPIARDNLYNLKLTDRLLNPRLNELATAKKSKIPANNQSLMLAQQLMGEATTLDSRIIPDIQMGMSSVDAAGVGLDAMRSMMSHMEGLAEMAYSSGSKAEREMYANQYDMLREQTYSLAGDSSFYGENVVINKKGYQMPVDFAAQGASGIGVKPIFFDGPLTLIDEHTGAKYTVSPNGKQLIGDERVTTTKTIKTKGTVGNLDDIHLRVRNDNSLDRDAELRQIHSKGDVDGDGVSSEGEGLEIDFVLDNSSGTQDSTGISFSNARIESTSGKFSFLFNTSATLPDAKAGQTVTTNKGTDLDVNIPYGIANGEKFYIIMDFKADGQEVKGAKFGEFTVGDLRSGQLCDATCLMLVAMRTGLVW